MPIAEMMRASGVNVEVIDEHALTEFARLRDAEQLRNKYDVIWLGAFDSLWKLLDNDETEGLKKAVHAGVGFIHTGGRGSFHGGFGEGACLDFTTLADILPIEMRSRYDLVLGEADERTAMLSVFSPLSGIHVPDERNPEWNDGGLSAFGLPGYNDTRLKPDALQVLTIEGHPLFAIGRYGQGRTVAFTGFTPSYSEQHADWDSKIVYPYLVDQEMYRKPVTRAYFYLFMELLAAATGEKSQVSYDALLAARKKPLFELLKELPAAQVKVSVISSEDSANEANISIQLQNGNRYTRLLRIRSEWDGSDQDIPYLVLYDDNFFDMSAGESRVINAKLLFTHGKPAHVSGKLMVLATNVELLSTTINFPSASAKNSSDKSRVRKNTTHECRIHLDCLLDPALLPPRIHLAGSGDVCARRLVPRSTE